MTKNTRTIGLIGMIFVSFLTTACGLQPKNPPAPPAGPSLDPVFRAFYNYLGADERLGPVISDPFNEGLATAQYVWAGKLVFDPSAPATGRFRLDSLGVQKKVSEPPTEAPDHPEFRYLNGHTILPDFYPLYEELGAAIVGLPLTEARHNYMYGRWEQYFENLGFYRMDGSEEVRLLAYGAWSCGNRCDPTHSGWRDAAADSDLLDESKLDQRGNDVIDPVFLDWVVRYGSDLGGFPLDPASTAPDGMWEQILENVVLVAPSRKPGSEVTLRPLSELLKILPEPPRPYSGDPNMYFLASSDPSLGYEIPIFFWEYITENGGLSMFGVPISHFSLLKGSAYHQCFQNLCLAYDHGAVDGARIRPEPLGYAYKYLLSQGSGGSVPAYTQPGPIPSMVVVTSPTAQITAPAASLQPTAIPTDAPTAVVQSLPSPTASPLPLLPPTAAPPVQPMVREITIQVYVRYRTVETTDAQEIAVRILENGQPVMGGNVDVTVGMPDGTLPVFAMPATDLNGYANLLLPVITAPPSTVIPYKTCYTVQAEMRMCVGDSFVIWYTP